MDKNLFTAIILFAVGCAFALYFEWLRGRPQKPEGNTVHRSTEKILWAGIFIFVFFLMLSFSFLHRFFNVVRARVRTEDKASQVTHNT